MNPEELRALADRCERERPNRALEIAIEQAVQSQWPLSYTTSLDAAVTLVPDGFVWGAANLCGPTAHVVGAEDAEGKVPTGDSDAEGTKSVALALCAAALRARAHTETQGGE